jgi:diguanylate cyclase (GGDEF)-like protein/PAS domain S-box-containing protein
LVRELFSLSSEKILGRDDTEFFSADTVSEIYKHDQRVLEHGETIRDEERVHPKGSLNLRIYWTVKMPIYDQQGHIRGLCGISTDITERKQIEDTLRNNQELLSTVLDNIGACVYMKAEDGRYLYANAAMALLHQRRPERLIGLRDNDLFPKDVAERLMALDTQAFQSKDKVSGMEIFQFADQEPRYYWSVKVPLTRENGEIYAVLGMSTDMTDRKRLEDELLRLATTDELTNLYNRRHFFSLSEQTLQRSRRYDEPLALLMCDIDFFKHINDTFGHATGDLVLQRVAEIIHLTLRDTDIAGRIGGEEFAILLVQTSQHNALEVAERLRHQIENSRIYLEDGHLVPLTMSIGVAIPVYPLETLATLLQHADQALYQAKRAGRNQICLAS